MHIALQQMVIGATNGLLFALIALGYSLVYSVLGLINFAHGDVFMLCAFLALVLMHGVPPAYWHAPVGALALVGVALVVALCGAVLNVAINRFVYRRARRGGPMAPLVAAVGASLVLQNVGLLLGTLPLQALGAGQSAAAPKAFVQPLSQANLLPAQWGLWLSAREMVCALVAAAALAGLLWLVHGSRLGRAMRAVAQDPVAAALMGIDAQRTIAAAFALAGALAGLAAVIYGLFIGTVHYQMGFQNGLYAFSAAVTGGLGSIWGAVLGALLLGLARALSDQWLGGQWQPAVVFGCLLLVLVLRPQGLLGRGAEKV